jgi:hypothetical protein
MDNDNLMKKKLVSYYKNVKFKFDYRDSLVYSEEEGNLLILNEILSKNPFMCVRLGAVESRCIFNWINNKPFTSKNIDSIHYAAGVFPQDDETIRLFCKVYADALKDADVLGLWSVVGEKKIMKMFCPSSKLVPLRSIEPYYHKNPWSEVLKNKRVLIVHPFVDSIKEQYEKRTKIFNDERILPKFKELLLVRAVQSNGGAQSSFSNWFDALDFMKSEIKKLEFDVAIIGAGAYGVPLASYVKSLGKQAIQMAGSTQILFGIKGNRWDSHPIISGFYNDYWIRASNKETPPKINKVEGGSYW